MRVHTLEREQRLPGPPEQAFGFFGDAANLAAITPGWLSFRILSPEPIDMRAGTLLDYRITLHGVPVRWRTRIESWDPPLRFTDRQIRGPYRLWHHTHTFERGGEETLMRDVVRYALPLGPLGAIAHVAFVRRDLERIFAFRQQAVERLMASSGTPRFTK